MTLDEIKYFIETLLDIFRRSKALFDPITPIFERFWHEGNEEVQHGFVPPSFAKIRPFGLTFEKTPENESYGRAFYSKKGKTLVEDFALKSGIKKEDLKEFFFFSFSI